MGATSRRNRGRDAITQVAADNELPSELRILSERWNTVAQLGDSGVIAKAATLASLAKNDPVHWFQQEVAVCEALSARGAPVQTPYSNQTFLPGNADVPVTLWHVVQGEMGAATEQQLVDSLAEIHRLGRDLKLNQPWFATITSHFPDIFDAFRDRNVVDATTVQQMDARYQHLMDRVTELDLDDAFIHGDAQRKNAIASDNGAVWIDFEECSIGPVAWDLACLAMHARFDVDRILDRYAEISGTDRIPNRAITTMQELRDLEAMTWMLAIQEEREPEFQLAAATMLAAWRASVG